MPYIERGARNDLEWMFHPEFTLETLGRENTRPASVGELNYCISRLIDNFIYDTSPDGESYNYAKLNEVLGVLSAVTLELNGRFIRGYEIQKRIQHGEVFCHMDTMAMLMEDKIRFKRLMKKEP